MDWGIWRESLIIGWEHLIIIGLLLVHLKSYVDTIDYICCCLAIIHYWVAIISIKGASAEKEETQLDALFGYEHVMDRISLRE